MLSTLVLGGAKVSWPHFLLSLLVLTLASDSRPTEQVSKKTQNLFVAIAPENGASCSFDQVLISPRGKHVVVWRDEEAIPYVDVDYRTRVDQVQIVSANNGRSSTSALAIKAPGNSLTPVSFSADGETLWLLLSEDLVEMRVVDGSVRQIIEIGKGLKSADVQSATHGNPVPAIRKFISETSELVTDDMVYKVYVTIQGTTPNTIFVREGAKDAHILQRGVISESSVPVALLRQPFILRDSSRLSIFTLGRSAADRSSGGERYTKPVVDLSTGKLVGSFTPISLSINEPFPGSALFSASARHGYLRDVAVSGKSTAALFGDHFGSTRLFVSAGTLSFEHTFCDRADVRAGAEDTTRSSSAPTSLAPRQTSIVSFGERTANQSGSFGLLEEVVGAEDLLLFFHGGPGVSMLDGDAMFASRSLRGSPVSVLSVEYPGSAAGPEELLESLRIDGIGSIENNTSKLMQWVVNQKYKRVHILAGSFGSVPALATLSQAAERVCSTTFVAPLLTYRRPAQLFRGETTASRKRQAFEAALIGGPVRLRELQNWLQIHKGLVNVQKAKIFFAASDPLSRTIDLDVTRSGSSTTLAGNHQSILQSEAVWSHVRDKIASARCS